MTELTNFQKLYLLIHYMRHKGNLPDFNGYLNEVYTQDNIKIIADAITQASLRETKSLKSNASKTKISTEIARRMNNDTSTLISKKFNFLPVSPTAMLFNHYSKVIKSSVTRNLNKNYITPFTTREDISGYAVSIYPKSQMQTKMSKAMTSDADTIANATNSTRNTLSAANISNYMHNTLRKIVFTFHVNNIENTITIKCYKSSRNAFIDFLNNNINSRNYTISNNLEKITLGRACFEELAKYFVYFTTTNIKSPVSGTDSTNDDNPENQKNSIMDIAAQKDAHENVDTSEEYNKDTEIDDNTSPVNNIKLLFAQLLEPEQNIDITNSTNKVFDTNRLFFHALLNATPSRIEKIKNAVTSSEKNYQSRMVDNYIKGKEQQDERLNVTKKSIYDFAMFVNELFNIQSEKIKLLRPYSFSEVQSQSLQGDDKFTPDTASLVNSVIMTLHSTDLHTLPDETLVYAINALSANNELHPKYNLIARDILNIQLIINKILNEEIFSLSGITTASIAYREPSSLQWRPLKSKVEMSYFELFVRPVLNNNSYVANIDGKWKFKVSNYNIEKEELPKFHDNKTHKKKKITKDDIVETDNYYSIIKQNNGKVDAKTEDKDEYLTKEDVVNEISKCTESLKPIYKKIEILNNIASLITKYAKGDKLMDGYPYVSDDDFNKIVTQVKSTMEMFNTTSVNMVFASFYSATTNYLNNYIDKCTETIASKLETLNKQYEGFTSNLLEHVEPFTTEYGENIPEETIKYYIGEISTFDEVDLAPSDSVNDINVVEVKEVCTLIDSIAKIANYRRLPAFISKDYITIGELRKFSTSDEFVKYLVDIIADICKNIDPTFTSDNMQQSDIMDAAIKFLTDIKLSNPIVNRAKNTLIKDGRIEFLLDYDFDKIKTFIMEHAKGYDFSDTKINVLPLNAKRIDTMINGTFNVNTAVEYFNRNIKHKDKKFAQQKEMDNQLKLSSITR